MGLFLRMQLYVLVYTVRHYLKFTGKFKDLGKPTNSGLFERKVLA